MICEAALIGIVSALLYWCTLVPPFWDVTDHTQCQNISSINPRALNLSRYYLSTRWNLTLSKIESSSEVGCMPIGKKLHTDAVLVQTSHAWSAFEFVQAEEKSLMSIAANRPVILRGFAWGSKVAESDDDHHDDHHDDHDHDDYHHDDDDGDHNADVVPTAMHWWKPIVNQFSDFDHLPPSFTYIPPHAHKVTDRCLYMFVVEQIASSQHGHTIFFDMARAFRVLSRKAQTAFLNTTWEFVAPSAAAGVIAINEQVTASWLVRDNRILCSTISPHFWQRLACSAFCDFLGPLAKFFVPVVRAGFEFPSNLKVPIDELHAALWDHAYALRGKAGDIIVSNSVAFPHARGIHFESSVGKKRYIVIETSRRFEVGVRDKSTGKPQTQKLYQTGFILSLFR